ncbi:hypothetical protein GUITHDRAFT_148763 [Guillardia theta CCMP2712]|uniref:Uncharacterized protein n=1 Tax=Guillardia theta (strain CCMP2712) TaxID=905079 RepID=L1I8T9_GUITC|nr:hypothetical protein GUITHDRAFT_148763 [Guillardia theta CCMP2712]EKX32260.1 hypothetical protein GUITHDRAFT_148763 [Guillardia theta CCMP2712]|eukprot:XP_005819240.1 hypothetical protein GUITHDRAFT_148763 [Guillardia theta CCMP2712]
MTVSLLDLFSVPTLHPLLCPPDRTLVLEQSSKRIRADLNLASPSTLADVLLLVELKHPPADSQSLAAWLMRHQAADISLKASNPAAFLAALPSLRQAHDQGWRGPHTLDLTYCGLSDDAMDEVANSLETMPRLRSLKLRSNRISGEGARKLFAGFKHTPDLQYLDLDWNSLGNEGAFYLRGGLELVPGLRSLKMRCNEVDGKGAAILFAGLREMPSLRDLDMVRGEEAGERVGRGLKGLRVREQRNNDLGEEGAAFLEHWLEHSRHCQIRMLDLVGNGISEESGRSLARKLQRTCREAWAAGESGQGEPGQDLIMVAC